MGVLRRDPSRPDRGPHPPRLAALARPRRRQAVTKTRTRAGVDGLGVVFYETGLAGLRAG